MVGRFKVFMIDEVHMLSTTAFNAMLKTLEEPPDYLKFVLATTDPQKVPVTVLSRCLQFNLRPMSAPEVQSHLPTCCRPRAWRLTPVRCASWRGGTRFDARCALTDQAIAFGGGSWLAEAGVRQMLGSVDRGHVVSLVDALAARAARPWWLKWTRCAANLSAAGTLEDLAQLMQQMALVRQAVPAALDDADPKPPRCAASSLLPADEVQLIYSMALHGRQELPLAPPNTRAS